MRKRWPQLSERISFYERRAMVKHPSTGKAVREEMGLNGMRCNALWTHQVDARLSAQGLVRADTQGNLYGA